VSEIANCFEKSQSDLFSVGEIFCLFGAFLHGG
jgi:hypothetical protein